MSSLTVSVSQGGQAQEAGEKSEGGHENTGARADMRDLSIYINVTTDEQLTIRLTIKSERLLI